MKPQSNFTELFIEVLKEAIEKGEIEIPEIDDILKSGIDREGKLFYLLDSEIVAKMTPKVLEKMKAGFE